MYIYLCIYITSIYIYNFYIYICVNIHTYIYINMYIHTSVYICTYVHIYVYAASWLGEGATGDVLCLGDDSPELLNFQ